LDANTFEEGAPNKVKPHDKGTCLYVYFEDNWKVNVTTITQGSFLYLYSPPYELLCAYAAEIIEDKDPNYPDTVQVTV
jgi:hypothetical protein